MSKQKMFLALLLLVTALNGTFLKAEAIVNGVGKNGTGKL